MTTHELPDISTLVEMTGSGPPLGGMRVEQVRGATLDLALPSAAGGGHSPQLGDAVTLRWAAGQRGRYVVSGTITDLPAGDRVAVTVGSQPRIEQKRQFVRGGGGEPVWLYGSGQSELAGWVRDISEQGIRAHFPETAIQAGAPLRLRVELGDDCVEVVGSVFKVNPLPMTDPPQAMRVEVIAKLDTEEPEAQLIRRYVLRLQMLARRAAQD